MAKVVSFVNMKGGVGKTTLTVNVAAGLTYFHNRKVLIIDCDPQFNASTYLLSGTDYLSHINDKSKRTILDIFQPEKFRNVELVAGKGKGKHKVKVHLKQCTRRILSYTDGSYLDLVPSTLDLFEVESSTRGTEKRLKHFISEVESEYDYVLLDCPPTISVFLRAALLASGSYTVPLRPDPLSVIGMPLLERWIEELEEDEGVNLDFAGMIFCMVRSPATAAMKSVMRDLRFNRGDKVFDAELGLSTQVAKSVEEHKPVFLTPNGRLRKSKWASQVEDIAKEFLERFE